MKISTFPLLLTSFVLSAPLALAADITWDIDPAAGIQGGTGNWNNAANTNWTTDGGLTRTAWDNLNWFDDSALFSAGTGTVTLAGTLSLAELRLSSTASATLNSIVSSGYRFLGGTLAFGAAPGTITTTAAGNLNQQISSSLTGSAGLVIATGGGATGEGRLVLDGNNTGLTGGITLNAGLVAFTSQNAAGSNLITLNGGGIFGAANYAGTGAAVVNGVNQSLNNNIALNNVAGNSVRVWGGRELTLTGTLSGTGGFTKTDTGTLILTGNNTFSGPVTVGAGTLSVASLNRVTGGTASSALGTPATAADGIISLSGSAQGFLSYIGSGETTDRVIRFANGNGGVINQNGGGTLNFTSDMTGAAVAMGVTLGGNGNGSINGITNTTALLNFNKSGLGTWTVNGNLTPNGGNIRPQGGILAFSATASTTGAAIISGRSNGGILKFASGSNVVTSTANSNGILGGWATFDDNTWAVANGASAVSGLATFTNDTWAAGNNTDVTAGGANPASGSTTNSLRLNAAGAKTITLAGTNTLTSGGLMITGNVGSNSTTITGGNLNTANIPGTTAGATVADLVIHQNNAAGNLTIGSFLTNATAPAARTGTAGTTAVITGIGSTADLVAGMTVTGAGVPANVTISSINSVNQITLSAATTVAGTPTLTFGTSNNGLIKTGPGATVLTSANTYSGTTYVSEGSLEVQAKGSGNANYLVSKGASLYLGYNVGNGYTHGVTIAGDGAASAAGLYLKGGTNINLQNNGGLNLTHAPSTVRTYGTGPAILSGYDTNGTHLTVAAAASGSVLDSNINIVGGSFGYVINTAPGANTLTGDVTIQGQLNVTNSIRKNGGGSLLLTGASTNTAPVDIRAGSVILSGGNNRLGAGSSVILGNGTTSGKLLLNGIAQTVTNLTTAGTGTANAVVGNSAALSTLTVNYTSHVISAGPPIVTSTTQTFSGILGGTGTNENNLALAKSGTGTYVLSGTNTYTGPTSITGGTLQFAKQASLYNNTPASWTPANLTVSTGAVAAFSVGGTGEFASSDVSTLLTNLKTVSGNGLLAGSSVGFDTTNAAGGTFTVSDIITNSTGTGSGSVGLVKLGTGTLILNGANANTGIVNVVGGVLQVDANNNAATGTATPRPYQIQTAGTLQLGYSTGDSVYGYGVTVNGAGTAATTGLQLKGGNTYVFQNGLILNTAPTTVRGYGTGKASLAGWDTNFTHLTVSPAASGSVIDSNIEFKPGGYGYVMNIAAGANTATGDITFQGPLTGAINGNGTQYRKTGAGSLLLTGAGTNTAPVSIQAGSVILSGGNNRLGSGSSVVLGNGTGSGRLVLNGMEQTLTEITTSGTGTANAVVGNNATLSILTLNYTGAGQTFAGRIGGAGVNENNLALVKSGPGTYTLSGASTYTGSTTVSAGTLLVNGTLDAGSAVTVEPGATLGGSGSVPGSLTVSGLIAPGNSIGFLTTGAISFAAGSTFAYELNSAALGGDLLKTPGNLSLAGTPVLTLSETATGVLPNDAKLTLINYGGLWNGGLFSYLGNPLTEGAQFTLGGNEWRFSYDDPTPGSNFSAETTGGKFVTLTVVPEPGTAGLMAGLSLLALRRRRPRV